LKCLKSQSAKNFAGDKTNGDCKNTSSPLDGSRIPYEKRRAKKKSEGARDGPNLPMAGESEGGTSRTGSKVNIQEALALNSKKGRVDKRMSMK